MGLCLRLNTRLAIRTEFQLSHCPVLKCHHHSMLQKKVHNILSGRHGRTYTFRGITGQLSTWGRIGSWMLVVWLVINSSSCYSPCSKLAPRQLPHSLCLSYATVVTGKFLLNAHQLFTNLVRNTSFLLGA